MPLGLPKPLRNLTPSIPKLPNIPMPDLGGVADAVGGAVSSVASDIGNAASDVYNSALDAPMGQRLTPQSMYETARTPLGTAGIAEDVGNAFGAAADFTFGNALRGYGSVMEDMGVKGPGALNAQAAYQGADLSRDVGKFIGSSIVPTEAWELPLMIAPVAGRVGAGIKAGEPLLKTLAAATLEGIAFGPDVAKSYADDLGPNIRRILSDETGSFRMFPEEEALDPAVQNLAFGTANLSDMDKARRVLAEEDGFVPLEGGGTIWREDDGTFTRRTPVKVGDKWTEESEHFRTLEEAMKGQVYSRASEAPEEAAMRRAMSDEELGTATRFADDEVRNLLDRNGAIEVFRADDDDFTGDLLRNGTGYFFEGTDADGGEILKGFGSFEEAMQYFKNNGFVAGNKNPYAPGGFEQADDRVLNSPYSKLSESGLKDKLEEARRRLNKAQTFKDDITSLQEEAYGSGAQPSIAHDKAISDAMTEVREIQSWIDLRAGKNTPGADQLQQVIDRSRAINPIGGGAPNAVTFRPQSDIKDVLNSVVTVGDKDPLIKRAITRLVTLNGLTNPSVLLKTREGQLAVAMKRLDIESEGIIDTVIRGGWDTVARNNQRDVLQLDVNDMMQVTPRGFTEKIKVPWKEVFEYPDNYVLSDAQRLAADKYYDIVMEAEKLRIQAGLPPREAKMPKGKRYIPGQVKSSKGVAMPRHSKASLPRTYDDTTKAVAEGVEYFDPRSTLEVHLMSIYKEISNSQLEGMMAHYGVKPSELVPQFMRTALDMAFKAYNKAKVLQKFEATKAQRYYNRMFTKDNAQALRQLADARGALRRLEGELAGRGQLAAGQRRTPVSYGLKLADARAKIEAAKAWVDQTQPLAAAASRPPALKHFVSQEALLETEKAHKSFQAAQTLYTRRLEAIQKSASGMVVHGNSVLYQPEVINARRTLLNAEKTQEDIVAKLKKQHVNFQQDPEWQAANAARKDANDAYKAAIKAGKETALDESRTVKEWHGKFYPIEGIEELEAGLKNFVTDEAGGFTKVLQTTANVMRTGATAFDFSTPFIHGLPVLTRDPIGWSHGVWGQFAAFVNPKYLANMAERNSDVLQEMSAYMGTPTAADLFNAVEKGGGISLARLDKMGPVGKEVRRTAAQVGKQTVGRFANGYETALLTWRMHMWKGMKGKWLASHAGTLSEKESLYQLGQHIRNMTGGMDARALGVTSNQRAWESTWMALSPKLLRSTMALVGDLRYGPFDSRGFAAARGIASLMAGVTAGYWASGKALGKTDDEIKEGLNPLNGKKFLSHKIGNEWIGVGGTARFVSQLLASFYTAAAPKYSLKIPEPVPFLGGADLGAGTERPVEDLWARNSQDNPLISSLLSRGAPGLTIALPLIEGITGWDTDAYKRIDNLPDAFTHIGLSSLPFAASSTIEAMLLGTKPDTQLGVAASMFGARSSPETPTEERLETIEMEVIPELKGQGLLPSGVDYMEDLGPGERNLVERYLKENRPDLVKEYENWRRDFNSIYQQKDDERALIEAKYKPELDRLYQDLLIGIVDPKEIQSHLSDTRNRLRGALDQLYNDPAYLKEVSQFDRNEMQKLADEYFQIPNQIKAKAGFKPEDDYNFSNAEWDEIEKMQQSFLTNLDSATAKRFLADMSYRDSVAEAHPIIQLKREIDSFSEAYNNLQSPTLKARYIETHPEVDVKRWVFYGGAMQSIAAVELALNKGATGLAGKAMQDQMFNRPLRLADFPRRIDTDRATWEKDKKTIQFFLQLPSEERGKALEQVPAINAASVYWGHTTKIHKPETLPMLDAYMKQIGFPNWATKYQQIMELYWLAPDTSKEKLDKPKMMAASPIFDATVNAWNEIMFGKEPKFKTEAGRAEYFKLTGRDASRFEVVPLE